MANIPAGVLVNYECEVLHHEDILVGVENPPTNAFVFQITARNKIALHYFVRGRIAWEFQRYIHESPHFSRQVMVKFEAISENETEAFNGVSAALREAHILTGQHPEMIANIRSNAARLAHELGITENGTLPILVDITKVFIRIIDNPYEHPEEDESEEEEEDDDGQLLNEVMNEVMRFTTGQDTLSPAAESSIAALQRRRMGEGGNCCICLEVMAVDTEVTVLPCNHMFHGGCIVNWLRTRNVCPLCRFRIPAAN